MDINKYQEEQVKWLKWRNADLQSMVNILEQRVSHLERLQGVKPYRSQNKLIEMRIVDGAIDGTVNTIKLIFRRLRGR